MALRGAFGLRRGPKKCLIDDEGRIALRADFSIWLRCRSRETSAQKLRREVQQGLCGTARTAKEDIVKRKNGIGRSSDGNFPANMEGNKRYGTCTQWLKACCRLCDLPTAVLRNSFLPIYSPLKCSPPRHSLRLYKRKKNKKKRIPRVAKRVSSTRARLTSALQRCLQHSFQKVFYIILYHTLVRADTLSFCSWCTRRAGRCRVRNELFCAGVRMRLLGSHATQGRRDGHTKAQRAKKGLSKYLYLHRFVGFFPPSCRKIMQEKNNSYTYLDGCKLRFTSCFPRRHSLFHLLPPPWLRLRPRACTRRAVKRLF